MDKNGFTEDTDEFLCNASTSSTSDTLTLEQMAQLVIKAKADIDQLDERMAEVLLEGGFGLIPCDYLRVDQLVVHPRLYEAAKRVVARRFPKPPEQETP